VKAPGTSTTLWTVAADAAMGILTAKTAARAALTTEIFIGVAFRYEGYRQIGTFVIKRFDTKMRLRFSTKSAYLSVLSVSV
jgi:hypothetical protein